MSLAYARKSKEIEDWEPVNRVKRMVRQELEASRCTESYRPNEEFGFHSEQGGTIGKLWANSRDL